MSQERKETESVESACPPGHRLVRPVRWLIFLNALAVVLLGVLVLQNSSRSSVRTWEYKSEAISDSGFADRLNVLGKQRWELISVRKADDGPNAGMEYEAIFKRPVGE